MLSKKFCQLQEALESLHCEIEGNARNLEEKVVRQVMFGIDNRQELQNEMTMCNLESTGMFEKIFLPNEHSNTQDKHRGC